MRPRDPTVHQIRQSRGSEELVERERETFEKQSSQGGKGRIFGGILVGKISSGLCRKQEEEVGNLSVSSNKVIVVSCILGKITVLSLNFLSTCTWTQVSNSISILVSVMFAI